MHILHVLTQNSNRRLFISLAAGLLAAAGIQGMAADTRIVLGWDVFAFCLLALSTVTFSITTPKQIRKVASSEDASRAAVFLIVMAGALTSLFAILFLLQSHAGIQDYHLTISVLAVVLSWGVVHISFCYRYAHAYYEASRQHGDSSACGIDFPHEAEPDYWDFAYFAFTIGMTAQVSDTAVTSRRIRRLVLVHSLISFAFNTVIISLSIGVISGMM